jgi:hypothetical protein
MRVVFRQFVFATDEMTSFDAGIKSALIIFVNPNGMAFLKLVRNCWDLAPYRASIPKSI